MKNIKIVTVFLFLIFSFSAVRVQALKRAPFPNSTLQPVPQNAQPNISGNVNSSGAVSPSAAPDSGDQKNGSSAMPDPNTVRNNDNSLNSGTKSATQQSSVKSGLLWTLIGILLALALGLGWFVFRRK